MSLRSMKCSGYRRYDALLVSITAVYLLFVFESERVPAREEIFPFASWSLFSKVPNVVNDYGLVLTAVDGVPQSPPLLYEHSRRWFWGASDHAAYWAILDLGAAVDGAAEGAEIDRRRRLIERLYLGNGKLSVDYQLVQRRWEPMQRWRTGEFAEMQVIAEYHLPKGHARQPPGAGQERG